MIVDVQNRSYKKLHNLFDLYLKKLYIIAKFSGGQLIAIHK